VSEATVRKRSAVLLFGLLLGFGCGAAAPPEQIDLVATPAPVIEVAITVDDLPRFEEQPPAPPIAIHRMVLKALANHGVPPVYGFVNGKKLVDHPADRAALAAWLAAGQRLGNHTYSHATITSPA
jgi:peptidoglycan/xylan/chitin deacetylase (PgdA/CDA1 family)